jgi:hypothetical protein
MEEPNLKSAAHEAVTLLERYLRERIIPHPILNRFLPEAAVCVTGAVAAGVWDEQSRLEMTLVLPDEEQSRLSAALHEAHLWDPSRDFRLRLEDREPFRRFPGAAVLILSSTQLWQELRFDLPIALWSYRHAGVLQDPLGTLETALRDGGERFQAGLDNLRCEHYYLFRLARRDMVSQVIPRRPSTALAIKRGETVREALRLAFLAEGKPYPPDAWLETMAEQETACGSGIVTAVRALIAARETQTVERAGKVLRDRVAFALQQGGVRERWLEQWWLWPSIAPAAP